MKLMSDARYYRLISAFNESRKATWLRENFDLVKSSYFDIYKEMLRRIGVNPSEELLSWGENGYNWKALHETDFDNKMNIVKAFDILVAEMVYISDRLCFDRIGRMHWYYRRFEGKVKK